MESYKQRNIYTQLKYQQHYEYMAEKAMKNKEIKD